MGNFQIFIATHNRSDLICKTIDSILIQKGIDFEVIVSDNSTNEETAELVKDKYAGKINYIRRGSSVGAIAHWDLILKEVTADYFMIFHDDDTMNEGMLKAVEEAFNADASLVAVGSNAYTVTEGKRGKTWFLKDYTNDQVILNGTDMAGRYFEPNRIVPFPAYTYKKIIAENFSFDYSKGGKYSDVAFLIDVANHGKVLLLAKPLMDYYIHSAQYSFVNDFSARLKLVNYILKNTGYNRSDKKLRSYRLNNIYKDNIANKTRGPGFLFKKRALILLKEKDLLSYVKLSVLTILPRLK